MKYIVRKAFWDYEKEEKWLNEMSAKGLALTDYSWCRYVFEETPQSEYTYRIELLENLPTHAESIAYIKFLEESGIEYVSSYMRWIYIRKKSSDGVFDIYSDADSKIKHYKRVNTLWSTLMWSDFAIGLSNIITGVKDVDKTNIWNSLKHINLFSGIFLVIVGLLFFRLGSPIRKKIRKLQQEKIISE